MRSLKRFAITFLIALAFIIFTYTILSSLLSVDDIDEQLPLESRSSGQDLFNGYWSSNNFTESLFYSLNKIRLTRRREVLAQKSTVQQALHLKDYLDLPVRVFPYKFEDCRMSNCFNYSRCPPSTPLKVYIVPASETLAEDVNSTIGESNLIHENILKIIRNSKHYEPNPDKACIFVLEDDTLDRDPLSKSFRPELANVLDYSNNYGMNYLIFNLYAGSWPDYRENDFAGLHFGAAIVAKASNSVNFHRPEFDISLPLFSYLHPFEDDKEDNYDLENQTYFLTFKGKRYVIGGGSDTRNNLYHLNNDRDIIMLTTCRHGKKWRESSDARCLEDETTYEQYDFVDLMKKSTFCLTPRGRRLGSFRYLEALSHGCIPVVLSDGWIKPFNEIIDWSCATIQFPEALLLQVPDMLKDMDPKVIANMRSTCRIIYNQYFSSIKKIVLTTLSIIERRILNQSSKRA